MKPRPLIALSVSGLLALAIFGAAGLSAQVVAGGKAGGQAPTSSGTPAVSFDFPVTEAVLPGEQVGFMVTPLPQYQTVQGLGENGVLLLRHIYTGELSRWRNGAIEPIDTTSIFAINDKGDFIRHTAGAGYVLEKPDGTSKIIQLDTGAFGSPAVVEFSDNFAVGYLAIPEDPPDPPPPDPGGGGDPGIESVENPLPRIPVRWDFSGGYLQLASPASHPFYPSFDLFQPAKVNDRGDYLAWKYSADGDYPLMEGTFFNGQLIEGLQGVDLNNQGSALLLKPAEAWNLPEIPYFWDGALHRIGNMTGVAVGLNDHDQIIAWEYAYPTDPSFPFPSFVRSSLWSRTMDAAGNISFGSIDLSQVSGLGPDAYAVAINNAGEVVMNEGVNQTSYHFLAPKSDRLGVDFDRDGAIDVSRDPANPDRKLAKEHLPWYFWVNDDNDSGETDGSDIPGAGANANGQDDHVNGVRDLVDFFPVHLDLAGLLQAYPATDPTIAYKLAQADSAANFLTTDLKPNEAGKYHSDAIVAQGLGGKPVTQITAAGVALSPDFLGRILTADGGIILVEARTATTAPLRLEVWRGTTLLSKLELPLSFGGVETMFRHKNLVNAVGVTPETADREGVPPNWPDRLNNNQAFVFVHGYNVNQQQARGWQAEFFKRLWWSGSNARFYGVTWYGYDSQLGTDNNAFTPNYEINVVHAFGTAPRLKDVLNEVRATPGVSKVYVAGHSLGNMVTSSAISDHSAAPDKYFLLNAAVASEAYDTLEVSNPDAVKYMPHTTWTKKYGEPYPEKLWASHWFERFPTPTNNPATDDARATLTWRDRFAQRGNTEYYDLYSTGDHVLMRDTDTTPELVGVLATELKRYLQEILSAQAGQPSGYRTWAYQEKLKGRTTTGKVLGSNYGGWGFNSLYLKKFPVGGGKGPVLAPVELKPAEATALLTTEFTDEKLRLEPFFRPGNDRLKISTWTHDAQGKPSLNTGRLDALYNPATGSAFAKDHRDTLLAQMIPALSFVTGHDAVEQFGADNSRNFDINLPTFRGTTAIPPWPANRGDDKNWRHSDLRVVAYPYVKKLYERLISLGALTQAPP